MTIEGGSPRLACARIALSLLVAAHAITLAPPVAAQQAVPVLVDAVRYEQLEETVAVLGRVVALQNGLVATRVAAPVAEIRAHVGDRVRAGDPLVVLDTTRLELDRNVAEAQVAVAVAEHTAALRELDLLRQERNRLERLKGSAAFSKARLDDKLAQIAATESHAGAALARLESAKVTLAYRANDVADAVIRAPYPGVVFERLVSPGAYVRVGDPVAKMVDHTAVEIEADVPAERLRELGVGREVAIRLGGIEAMAPVRAIVPMENPMTRTRAVRFGPILFAGGEAASAIGQSVTLDVPIGAARDILSVHKDAVTLSQGNRIVFVVDKEHTAQPRPVTLGGAVGGRFEVLGGLQDGDLVVVRGNERLRPGQAVAFEPPATEPPAPESSAAPDETPASADHAPATAGTRS